MRKLPGMSRGLLIKVSRYACDFFRFCSFDRKDVMDWATCGSLFKVNEFIILEYTRDEDSAM